MTLVCCLTRHTEGVRDLLPCPTRMDCACDRGTFKPFGEAAERDNSCEGVCRVVRGRDVVQADDSSIVVDKKSSVNQR